MRPSGAHLRPDLLTGRQNPRDVEYLESVRSATAFDDIGVVAGDEDVVRLAAVGKRALADAQRSGGVRDAEYLERPGRSRALHDVREAVPDPDGVAAARIDGARVGEVGLARQHRGRRIGYVEDLERVGGSRALGDVGVVA